MVSGFDVKDGNLCTRRDLGDETFAIFKGALVTWNRKESGQRE